MLDAFFREEGEWWDEFYADKEKGIPFFRDCPDENLVESFSGGVLTPGRVLELGCGGGRNAVYMARQGCKVDAVDISQAAVNWGMEGAAAHQVEVNFTCGNIFDLELTPGSYDLIYDSGCFHHIYPHRRATYLELLDRALTPGGYFGLTCFAAGSMGAEITDWEVYRQRRMRGGLGSRRSSSRRSSAVTRISGSGGCARRSRVRICSVKLFCGRPCSEKDNCRHQSYNEPPPTGAVIGCCRSSNSSNCTLYNRML